DEAGLAAFAEHVGPELAKGFPSPADLLAFREHTGGFDLEKPESETPTRYVALVKERGDARFARAVIEVDAGHRGRPFDILLVPTPDEYKPARLSEADAIAALEAELDSLVAQDKFSGAVLVAKHGKPIFTRAYGMADRDARAANTLDTRFRMGSMNKMFTA